MRLGQKLLLTFSASATTFALAAVTALLVARLLGPADRGVFAVVLTVPALLLGLGRLGIESSNLYYAARDADSLDRLIGNSLVIGTVVGFVVPALFVGVFQIAHEIILPGVEPFFVYAALAIVPFSLLNSYVGGILWGRSRITGLNVLSVIGGAAQFVGTVALLVVFDASVFELIVLTVFVAAFGVVAYLVLLARIPLVRIRFRLDLRLLGQTFGFSGKAYLANILMLLAYRFDIFLVNAMTDKTQLGHYVVAVSLTQMLWILPQTVNRILFIEISGTDPERANAIAPVAMRSLLWGMGGICVIAALFGGSVIRVVLGPSYVPSIEPFLILLLAVPAVALLSVTSSYVSGRGKPVITMYISLQIFVVITVLDVIMIPSMGIAGAAWASTIGYVAGAIGEFVVVLVWSRSSLRDLLLIRPRDLRLYRALLR